MTHLGKTMQEFDELFVYKKASGLRVLNQTPDNIKLFLKKAIIDSTQDLITAMEEGVEPYTIINKEPQHILERYSAEWGTLEFCSECGAFSEDGTVIGDEDDECYKIRKVCLTRDLTRATSFNQCRIRMLKIANEFKGKV